MIKNKFNLSFYTVLLVVLFINTQTLTSKALSVLNVVDELIIVIAIAISSFSIFKSKEIKKNHLYIYLLFFFSIFISVFWINSFPRTPFEIVLLQSLITFKLFWFYFLFDKTSGLNANVNFPKIFEVVVIFSILGFFINLIKPEIFSSNFHNFTFGERTSRIVGLQMKPNDFAILLGFYCFFLASKIDKLILPERDNIKLLICLIMITITTSRTGLLIAFLAIFLAATKRKSFLSKQVMYAITFTLLGLFFAFSDSFFVTETIRNFNQFENIESSKYIRFIMLYYSFILSIDFFPFGTGAGTYGTVLSNDSWVYTYLGLSHLEFFQDFWGIYDSNIAGLIGEYGFIFSFLLFVCLYKLLRNIVREKRTTKFMIFIALIVCLFQPFLSYHVNAVNFLLLAFSLKHEKFNLR